jgi:hypothetical protein
MVNVDLILYLLHKIRQCLVEKKRKIECNNLFCYLWHHSRAEKCTLQGSCVSQYLRYLISQTTTLRCKKHL